MPTAIDQTVAFTRSLWRSSPPLTAVGLGMLVVLAASLAGLAVDPRVITGVPAWLKPAKFAISTAIYSLTIAWILGHVQDRPRAGQERRLGHRRDRHAGGGADRSAGRSRHHQPLQCRPPPRCGDLFDHGRSDRRRVGRSPSR